MVHVVTKMLTRKDMTLTSSYVLPKGILQTKQYSQKDCIFLSDIPVSARQNGSKSDLKNTHQVHGVPTFNTSSDQTSVKTKK